MLDLTNLFLSGLTTSKYSPKEVVTLLKQYIGHQDWFISGSFANRRIKEPRDVDVYFLTQEALTVAKHALKEFLSTSTRNADTIFLPEINIPIQLISRNTGRPAEVFRHFDLNVCKRALLPNGDYLRDPTANDPISIQNVNYDTFNRFLKYHYNLDEYRSLALNGKKVIDTYIEDCSILTGYYKSNEKTQITNKRMFEVFKEETPLRDYLLEQANKYAPELLI